MSGAGSPGELVRPPIWAREAVSGRVYDCPAAPSSEAFCFTGRVRHTLFGPTGLRVSELCLGTMTFGESWGWGAPKETCGRVLDLFDEAGGTFVDTANNYTGGQAEAIVGELLEGRRERFVVASKYTLQTRPGDHNAVGNQRKNLVQSLETTLRRLRTDYVDVYFVHARDTFTPVEEIVRALDDQVRLGKVLYVAVSDWPAWEIARATTIAELRGLTPFAGIELPYSLVERSPERELLPTARSSACAIGRSSRSGERSTSEYGSSIPAKGVRPRSSAIVVARAISHAGQSETAT